MSWIEYANQSATRNQPLDDRLVQALSFLPEMGVTMRVISGGQDGKGEGPRRTGSTRHDHGGAADADFYINGRKLDWNNPQDQPIFSKIVSNARARGVTGIGAGDDYMGAGRMHIGFGPEAVWGAGGSSANAPSWLREAYHGQPGHVHTPGDDSQQVADNTMAALGRSPMQQPANALAQQAAQGQPQQPGGYPTQNALAEPQRPQMQSGLQDVRNFLRPVQPVQYRSFT